MSTAPPIDLVPAEILEVLHHQKLRVSLPPGTTVARSMAAHMKATVCEAFEKTFTFAVSLLVVLALCAACGKNATATSPTSTTPDSVTETFAGTLPVGGAEFYAFSTAVAGTVTATLASIGGDDVPSSVTVNLGIGTLSGFTCSASSTPVQVTGTAQVPALVTTTEQPGVFCVIISDIGNLFAPASLVLSTGLVVHF